MIFELNEELLFPPPALADEEGLLAIGGDLSTERLLLAYSMGIFPWYSDQYPIMWWTPDPRLVLFPEELKISRSLRQTINKGTFTVTVDRAFEEVIRSCATIDRRGEDGTWLTAEMIEAYIKLRRQGYAHSVEAWHNGELAGGLYGLILGNAYFGESMFARQSDASKVAFVTFVEELRRRGITIIDCQVSTPHMKRFGAREISRADFMRHLKKALS